MRKGKFGICLSFYAILAFILAILGQSLLGALLMIFVLAVEKDEWATKQTMQAFFLTLFSGAVSFVLNIFDTFIFTYAATNAFNTFENYTNKLVDVAVLVFAIIGIVKTAKGQDAGIPVFSSLADKIYGHFTNNASNYQSGYNPYANAQAAQQPQQPQQNNYTQNTENNNETQNNPYTFNTK